MTSYFSAKTDYDTSKNRFKLNELFSFQNENYIKSVTFSVKSILPLNGKTFDKNKLKVSYQNLETNVQANIVDNKQEYICTIDYEKDMAEKILNNIQISYPEFSQITLEVKFQIYGFTSYSTKTKNISFVIANNFVKTKEEANKLRKQNKTLSEKEYFYTAKLAKKLMYFAGDVEIELKERQIINSEFNSKTKLSIQTTEFLKQSQQLLQSIDIKLKWPFICSAIPLHNEKNDPKSFFVDSIRSDLVIKHTGKSFDIPKTIDIIVIYDATQCLDKDGKDLSAFWYDKKQQKPLPPRQAYYMSVDYFKDNIEIKDGIGLTKVTSVTKRKGAESEIDGFDIQKTNIGCKDIMTIAGLDKLNKWTINGAKKEFVYTTPGK